MDKNIFDELKKPFNPFNLEWRIQKSGKTSKGIWALAIAYVDSRALRARLNDVVGPLNWRTDYHEVLNGICCKLSLRIDSEWLYRSDGAGETQIEAVKGGFSGAFKRACYCWGIGEYLYRLKATYAKISAGGKFKAKTKDGELFKWDPPKLPAWALPGVAPEGAEPEQEPTDEGKEMTLEQWHELVAIGATVKIQPHFPKGMDKDSVKEFVLYEADRIEVSPRDKKLIDGLLKSGVFEAAATEYSNFLVTQEEAYNGN